MEREYSSDLVGNIAAALAGLQGFDAMAYELIQNADDAKATRLTFDVRSDCLVVENDSKFSDCGRVDDLDCPWVAQGEHGRPVRPCDFHALSKISSGTKIADRNQIGRFGVGFVSVFQITDRPVVTSGRTRMALDPARGKVRVEACPPFSSTRFELPWAFNPDSPLRRRLADFPVTALAPKQIELALLESVRHSLYFLRHLHQVSIRAHGVERELIKIERSSSAILVAATQGALPQEWLVLRGDASGRRTSLNDKYPSSSLSSRQTELAVAFPKASSKPLEGRIYAYLPTDSRIGLPCHIHGDFFPKQDRRSIVFDGDFPHRHWNDALLEAAAEVIASNLLQIRDQLGPIQLWQLLTAIRRLERAEGGPLVVRGFWRTVAARACNLPLVPTTEGEWKTPSETRLPLVAVSSASERASAKLGVYFPAHTIAREARDALEALGSRDARAPDFATNFKSGAASTALTEDETRDLWPIIDRIIRRPDTGPDDRKLLARVPIALDSDGRVARPDQIYTLPAGVSPVSVRSHLASLRSAHDAMRQFSGVWALCDPCRPEEIAHHIRNHLAEPEAADRLANADDDTARSFYSFLAGFPGMLDVAHKAGIKRELSSCRFLRANGELIAPEKAALPGNFKDPSGTVGFVDVAALDANAKRLLEEVLDVRALSFLDFVVHYLPKIMAGSIDVRAYRSIIESFIGVSPSELSNPELQQAARRLPLVLCIDRTCRPASQAVRPSEEILRAFHGFGAVFEPTACDPLDRLSVLQLFERFGLRSIPSAEAVVSHIRALTQESISDDRAATVRAIIVAVARHWSEYLSEGTARHFDVLRDLAWIPPRSRDSLSSRWLYPRECYQPFRADAFESQCWVANFPPQLGGEFLSALHIRANPLSADVARHLIWCIEHKLAIPFNCYVLLSEALDSNDRTFLPLLLTAPVIWDDSRKAHCLPRTVFWSKPRLPRFLQATERHRQFKRLFDSLGVAEEPDATHLSEWLVALAERCRADTLEIGDSLAYDVCVERLGVALQDNPNLAPRVAEVLGDHAVVKADDGRLARALDVALVDAQWLADSLGHEFVGQLVTPSSAAASSIFELLGVRSLSTVATCKMESAFGLQGEDYTKLRLMKRLPFVQAVLAEGDRGAANSLYDFIQELPFFTAKELSVRYLMHLSDPPVATQLATVDVFLGDVNGRRGLVFRSDARRRMQLILRQVFEFLLQGVEEAQPGQLSAVASQLVEAPSDDEARDILSVSGIREWQAPVPAEEEVFDELLGELQGADRSEAAEDLEMPHASLPETAIGRQDRGERAQEQPADAPPDSGHHQRPPVGTPEDRVSAGTKTSIEADNAVEKEASEIRAKTSTKRSAKGEGRNIDLVTKVVERRARSAQREKRHRADTPSASDAVAMAMRYEALSGRVPREMAHNNPGFDIRSDDNAGQLARLIEVKGIEGAWEGWAVRMSDTQFQFGYDQGPKFWLYVVEYASDPAKQRLIAIQNPLQDTDFFAFEPGWEIVAREFANGMATRFVPNDKVRHVKLGPGIVVRASSGTSDREIVVKFARAGQVALRASDPNVEHDV